MINTLIDKSRTPTGKVLGFSVHISILVAPQFVRMEYSVLPFLGSPLIPLKIPDKAVISNPKLNHCLFTVAHRSLPEISYSKKKRHLTLIFTRQIYRSIK